MSSTTNKPLVTRLVTTKPAMSNSAAALRIPTIQRRIIAVPPPPSPSPSTMSMTSSRQAPHDTPLPIMEKTCGLFDFVDPTSTTTEIDKSELDMESNAIDPFFLFDISTNPLTSPIPAPALNTDDLITSPTVAKKTFAQKLEEANLKINIIKPDQEQESMTETPMLLDLDDTDIAKILTPGTENMCRQLLHSIPTEPQQHQQQSARVATSDQLLSSLGLTDNELLAIVQDHVYSAPTPSTSKRRRVSEVAYDDDDNDDDDDDDGASSVFSSTNTDATSPSTTKKRRTRGIYRAEDVTNETDLKNYLERRKKNNISSKISRANKKSYYLDMEAKMAAVEAENKRLAVKITKLEKVNQLMKDYLKEAFVGNVK